jgi:RNA polymerase sigma factor (sigma-70 family)
MPNRAGANNGMEQGTLMSVSAVVTRPPDGETDDRDLVARVRAGDDRAFELLFQRYQPRIAAYVRGMIHDHGRAEDITQEVFLSALRRMRQETEREILFKPWIFEIAKNKCIDAFRRTRNSSEVSFDARDEIGADEHGRLAEPGATPDSAIEGKVAIDNLCGAFGGLSAVHHDILVLRELEGLSYREIGDRLGMSRPAVESTLFRARKRLSAEYEQLVSGERCLRVQQIIDGSSGHSARLRDRRRMARHLAHCQPCRRYAGRAGVDLGPVGRPAAAAARIAAFLPLPAFLRRRWSGDEVAPLLGHGGPVSQWSANVAAVLDPGVVSGWTKAVATAATVAVAGMGAGAAFPDRAPLDRSATAGSPPKQAPPLGIFGARQDARTPADARNRTIVRDGLHAQLPRAKAAEKRVDTLPPTGTGPIAAPPTPADAPANTGVRRPDRPFEVSLAGTPVTGGNAQIGAARGTRPADRIVGRLLDLVGAIGRDTDGAARNATGATGAVAGDLLDVVTAPVRGTAESVEAKVASTAVTSAAATAVDGSVPPTVSKTLASTTTTLNSLGG